MVTIASIPASARPAWMAGAGTDTLTLADWAANSDQAWIVQTNQYGGQIMLDWVPQIDFTSIERFDLVMGKGNDFFTGTLDGNSTVRAGAGADTLYGFFGNEYFMGEAGNDTLDGGSGNDSLDGGEGNDLLVGGFGDDTLDGGAGTDRAEFSDIFAECNHQFRRRCLRRPDQDGGSRPSEQYRDGRLCRRGEDHRRAARGGSG
jgi:hypothetical protein